MKNLTPQPHAMQSSIWPLPPVSLNKTTCTRQLQLVECSFLSFPSLQAAEAAAVLIQHPSGRVERLYWPTSVADVMKSNPGHHVALVSLCLMEEKQDGGGGGGGGGAGARVTRVRLLKHKDMLLLGQVYRLISSEEVAKALRQRKHEKLKKGQAELIRRQQHDLRHGEVRQEDSEIRHQATRQERDQQKSIAQMALRSRHWRPSLQSISEMGS